jgi:SNW domain-containing protein 1
VEARSKMQRELLAREKERKERELRDLALKARMDRMGNQAPIAAGGRECAVLLGWECGAGFARGMTRRAG